MKRIVVAVVSVWISAFPSFAQQPPATAGEVIEVQITNLDVVVTDAKGKRVTGLTKDDFEVTEDGKKQSISNLSEISRTATATSEDDAAGSATHSAHRRQRHDRALRAAQGVRRHARRAGAPAPRAADRMAVATISHSVQERLNWTADKAEVLKVLASIEKDAVLPRPDLMAFEVTLAAIRDDADQAAASMSGPVTDRDGNNTPDSFPTNGGSSGGKRSMQPVEFSQVIAAARNYSASATTDTKRTLSALNASITAFAAVPGGRKIAILVGGGLPLNAADAVFQRIESVREQMELGGHRGMKGTLQLVDADPDLGIRRHAVLRCRGRRRALEGRGVLRHQSGVRGPADEQSRLALRRRSDRRVRRDEGDARRLPVSGHRPPAERP